MSRIATASLTLIGCEDSVAPFSTLQTRPTMSVEVVAPTTLVLRTIRPDSTDARIKQWVAPHYVVIDPAARPNGKLFVFFPGGNSTPADNTILAKEAARLGYRVIGLTYATSDPAKPGAAFGVGRCSTTTAQQPFR